MALLVPQETQDLRAQLERQEQTLLLRGRLDQLEPLAQRDLRTDQLDRLGQLVKLDLRALRGLQARRAHLLMSLGPLAQRDQQVLLEAQGPLHLAELQMLPQRELLLTKLHTLQSQD